MARSPRVALNQDQIYMLLRGLQSVRSHIEGDLQDLSKGDNLSMQEVMKLSKQWHEVEELENILATRGRPEQGGLDIDDDGPSTEALDLGL